MNMLRSKTFVLSDSLFETDFSERSVTVKLQFGICDVGTYPHLLVYTANHQFLVPLTYVPVSVQSDQMKQIRANSFEIGVSLINLANLEISDDVIEQTKAGTVIQQGD